MGSRCCNKCSKSVDWDRGYCSQCLVEMAAPDLFDALSGFVASIDMDNFDYPDEDVLERAMERAQKAIAKATGKS